MSKPVKYEIQTAMTAGADGLFKLMKRTSSNERPKATCIRANEDGLRIELRCFWQLDIYDETVALSILYLAQDTKRGGFLSRETQTETGKALRKIYDPDGKNEWPAGLIKGVSIYELAGVMGITKPSKKDYDSIRASLKRLGAVTMTEVREHCAIHHPVTFIGSRFNDDDTLDIVINNRLATAAFGEAGFHYALLDLNERQHLRSDIAKATHRFFVSWMWSQGRRTIGLDKLARHVWADWDNYTDSGKRCQLRKLKTAVLALNSLPDWEVSTEGRGNSTKVIITRKG